MLGGLSRFMPRSLRDMMRAFKYNGEGLRDSNGNEILTSTDMNPAELFLESMGIRTRVKARAYENKSAIDGLKNYHRQREKRFSERLWRARNDAGDMAAVRRDIDKYNQTRPPNSQVRDTIPPSRYTSEEAIQKYGANVNKKNKWLADQGRVW